MCMSHINDVVRVIKKARSSFQKPNGRQSFFYMEFRLLFSKLIFFCILLNIESCQCYWQV